MRITFFSSVLNHHQLSFCEELNTMPDVEFFFVQMTELTEERKNQGFVSYEKPYVVNAKREPARARRLCLESDVVIAGVIEREWVNERAAQGKLTLLYKERFLKDARALLSPSFWKNGYRDCYRFRNKEVYFLCASAYTARDTRFIFPRPEKKFKWGYFPTINAYEGFDKVLSVKSPNTILWAGRFLEWKHPERCIELSRRLREEGFDFTLTLVGLGDMQEKLEKMIREYSLCDFVKIAGQMSPEKVKEKMRESEIFLATSDRKEGWGAVLNEAMSEGCACIASNQAGSTGFLIRDGENGYSFDYDDIEKLFECTKTLLVDAEKRKNIQKKAFYTINNEWNVKVAASRLADFCTSKLNGEPIKSYPSGPMSIS